MLQTMDIINKALLWTTFAGLAFLAWMHMRAHLQKRDLLSLFLGEHLITSQVVSALLITCLLVVSFEFFFLPTMLIAHAAPVQADPVAISSYSLPDANISVVQIQGQVTQRPTGKQGEWQIGSYTFSTDAQSTIQVTPNQPVIACLVRHDGGTWKATVITTAPKAPAC